MRTAILWLSCAGVIRFLVYGIPALLAALVVAALVNVSLLKTQKKNELTLGTIGEATKLNPILSTETAASEIQDFIFEGLLQQDQDLNIAPLLASAYDISQTTTFFFTDAAAAANALASLQAAQPRWAGWKLKSARAEDHKLVLELSEAGVDASEKILSTFTAGSVKPLISLRVETGEKARATLDEFQKKNPDVTIVRSWFDYDAAFEIIATHPDSEAKLKDFFAAAGKKDVAVVVLEKRDFLAEPIIHFTLREDVRWQDGEPFTSRDVLFTYQSIMDEKIASPRKADYDLINSVETPGPYEVYVRYRKPYSPALLSWAMGILPAHILEGKSIDWWNQNFNRHPVGTGPFLFSQWKTNEFVKLVRNPNYYLGAPWLDSIVFRVLPDPISERIAFETHQTDYWGVDPWAVSAFQHDPKFQFFHYPANSYGYVGWNLKNPLFQDVRVRTAFAEAVNVPAMIKYIFYGNGVQSTGIFPPHFWFADQNIKPLPYDPAAAARLLDEAGWQPGPDGIRVKDGRRMSFTLIVNQANEERKDIATLVQDNLRKLGVEVKVEIYEWTVFINRFINKQEFEATVLGWVTPPDYDVFQVWHSSQSHPEQLNFVSYKNPRVDELIQQIRQEYNREKIKQMAGEIQQLIYKDQPYLFLFVPDTTVVIWNNSLRICRPDGNGGYIDTPIQVTKAGWSYYRQWFYRTDFTDQLPANRRTVQ